MYDRPSWLCPTTTPYPAARAVYLTSMMQTRNLIVNAIIVKCGNDIVSIGIPR